MIRHFFFALALCCTLLLKSTFSDAQNANSSSLFNLLPNPSFQASALGQPGSPAGWTWEGPADLATIVADKPLQTFGNSFHLDFRHTERSRIAWYCWSDYVPINSNQSYVQSGWIKTEGTYNGFGADLARRFYDADKKLIPTPQHQNFTAKNVSPQNWQYYSQLLVPQRQPDNSAYAEDEIPANACYIRVGIFAAYYPKQVWFNDIRLEKYNPAAAPLSYGDNKIVPVISLQKDQAIHVDGQEDENIWKSQGQWQDDFVRTVCPENQITTLDPAEQTRFKVAQDKENIYLFIQCNSPDPAAIKSTTTAHNDVALFGGDCVEVFLDATGEQKLAYHLGINPAGAFYEEWSGRTVNLGLHVTAGKTSTGWQAEVAIPRQMLWQLYHEAGSNMDNNLWNINVTRNAPNAGENKFSSWSYTGPSGFSNNANLGFLLLQDPRAILLSQLPDENQHLHQLAAQMPARADSAPILALKSTFNTVLQADDAMIQAIKNATQISAEDFVRALLISRRSGAVMKNTLAQMQRLMVELPADRKSFGYVIYRTPLFERPDAERIPATSELLSQIQLPMAENEQGQADFSIFTKTDLNNVQITWTDLKDAHGHVIPQNAVDVRILEPWGKHHQADILATDLRIKMQGWLSHYADQQRFIPLIAHDTSRKLWINVNAETSLPPGTYTGQINIQPLNKPASSVPFEVTLLPFKLPQTSHEVGFYYHGVLASENQPPLGSPSYMFYNGLTTPEECLREFKAMHQAGFTMIAIVDYAHGPLDADYSRQLLNLAKQAGFETVALMGSEHIITKEILNDPSKLAAARETLRQRIQAILKIAEEVGIKKLYIYGSDEPHTDDDYKRNKIIAETVHECGGKVAVAMIFSSAYAALQKDIDLPIMNWASMTSDPDTVQNYISEQKSGKRIAYYANLTADQTALSRLTFGWYLYKSGFAGNLPWAYYYLGLKWEPFTEEYPIYSAYYAFPTKDDPIPTLKFEAAAAGVTDLRYCEMLEDLIAACPDQTMATQARKKFDEMLQQVELINSKGTDSPNYSIPPETFDADRATLQQLILQLQKTQ